MKFSEDCIKRPVMTIMLNLALVLVGLVCLFKLPVRELPDVDPPIVTVTTIYPGANSQVVETEVTEKLESEINSIEGIKTLRSESREQTSNIIIEFTLARDIELAAQDVRDRVARVRGKLPEDIEEPIVAKQDSDASPMLWIAFFSKDHSTLDLTTFAENQIKDRLQTLPGVSSIILGGAKRYAIRIRLDPLKMASRGLTVLDIEQALKDKNIELPSGKIQNLEKELSIETKGELKTPEEFNSLVIKKDGNTLIRLRDIGYAEQGVEDENASARYNSQPALGLGIVKQSKANTVAVADHVIEEIKKLKKIIPKGSDLFVAYDESTYIRESMKEVWITLLVSVLLVITVIYLFLGKLSPTIVPALTIPVSILTTFAILSYFGYSINILTMLALVLAIGIVVDDSIVVLENIFRHIEEGMEPFAASILGMKEIAFAIIATTFALVAVFIPIGFQASVTGRLFIEFSVALAGSVIVSAFVALTLTPMVSARILKKSDAEKNQTKILMFFEKHYASLANKYAKSLSQTFNKPGKVIKYAIFSFVAAIGFFLMLEQEFLPTEDKGRLFSLALAPEGSTADYTNRAVTKMEEIVADQPEVAGYFSAVGLARSGSGKSNEGLIFVRLKEKRDRSAVDMLGGPHGLGARFFNEVPQAIAFPILPKAIGGGFNQDFQLVLQNDDLEKLNAFGVELSDLLKTSGFLTNIRSSFELNKPQLELNIDRNRADQLGVSIRTISRTIQILFGGLDLSKVKIGGKEYDVIVQLNQQDRLLPTDLNSIYVRSDENPDQLIQLSNILTYKEFAGPNVINRYNRMRSTIIEGTPAGVPLGTALKNVEEILKEKLPEGFTYDWEGEAKDLREVGSESYLVIIFALVIVYMVLAAQFESLSDPLIIMLTIPLATIGAFGSLWLLAKINFVGTILFGWANYAPDPPFIAHFLSFFWPRIPAMTLNVFSIIGIVLLVGLATKNSILLVEFANQKLKEGVSPKEAMKQAADVRFRPIMMSTVSTIAGILPIAIGFGVGAESRRPMGVAAVGGMISSTLLTLYVIPIVYILIKKASQKVDHES